MSVKFQVGDRVSRRANVFDETSRLLIGRVTRRYRDDASRFGPYDELYAVRWDGEAKDDKGFLPHGLDAFPEVTPVQPTKEDQ